MDFGNADFLLYEVVRRACGWKTNRPIREAVKAGKLKRVQIGKNTQDHRITRESLESFLKARQEEIEAAAFFEKTPGQMQAMRQAKKRRETHPVPAPVPEVTLTCEEVMAEADNLRRAAPAVESVPAPQADSEETKLGRYHMAVGAAKVQAYRALTWQQRNKLIEAGLV